MMEEAEAEGEGDAEGVIRVGGDGKVVVNETLGLKSRELSFSSFKKVRLGGKHLLSSLRERRAMWMGRSFCRVEEC